MERTILIAEDSPTQAEQLRLLLEGEGYRVDVVANGREGLERVQAAAPDLVISDVVMPEMDGYAFCREVKTTERTRRIPFVLLTERNTPADFIKGLQHGADNFITKPFEDDYLLERVRRIFENLELRRRGRLDVDITLAVGEQKLVINADKQQMIELLFATLEELVHANGRLAESQRIVEEYALDLEAVQERTRQLLQTEVRFASILDAAPEAVVGADEAQRIVLFSKGAVQIFGYTATEVIGQPIDLLLPSQFVAAHRRHVRDFAASPETARRMGERREVFGRRKDGSEFPAEATILKFKENDRTIFTAIVRDITERRRTEEMLRQTEKLSAMGQLLAGVAHELNNPLTVIAGHTAILRDRAGTPELLERSHKIAEAAKRCTRIVRNFLALARQQPPEREAVGLNQVAREAVELIAYQLRVDNIEIGFDLADDLPLLWADPHQLHRFW